MRLPQVMRIPLPSDLDDEEIWDAANSTSDSLAEVFIELPADESAGYLEMDLRPDKRYLYMTVPGNDSEPDGRVRGVSAAAAVAALTAAGAHSKDHYPRGNVKGL